MHMAQLMPLPLTVSCFSKIQNCFSLSGTAHPGGPGRQAVERVCVCVSVLWHCWLGVRKSIWPVRGADCLHMVQLMSLHPKTPSFLASFKSRLVLPVSYRLTQVVLEKRPLNGCSSSGSVAKWLTCWTQAQKGPGSNRSRDAVG